MATRPRAGTRTHLFYRGGRILTLLHTIHTHTETMAKNNKGGSAAKKASRAPAPRRSTRNAGKRPDAKADAPAAKKAQSAKAAKSAAKPAAPKLAAKKSVPGKGARPTYAEIARKGKEAAEEKIWHFFSRNEASKNKRGRIKSSALDTSSGFSAELSFQ